MNARTTINDGTAAGEEGRWGTGDGVRMRGVVEAAALEEGDEAAEAQPREGRRTIAPPRRHHQSRYRRAASCRRLRKGRGRVCYQIDPAQFG